MACMTSTRGSEVSGTLEPSTVEHLHLGWAEELDVDAGILAQPGTHFVARAGIGLVVVLDLFDTQVVLGPEAALEALRPVPGEARIRRQPVLTALAAWSPQLLGETSLSYAEDVRAPLDVEVAVSPVQNVDLLREHCTPEEWEESGLIDMPSRIAARRSDGKVAAVAGFERWGPHIAQLGVLVDPRWRGQGYGAAAAARAAQVAQGDQLVPQWRCRIDNEPSLELARRLGFVEVGRQLVVNLGDA